MSETQIAQIDQVRKQAREFVQLLRSVGVAVPRVVIEESEGLSAVEINICFHCKVPG